MTSTEDVTHHSTSPSGPGVLFLLGEFFDFCISRPVLRFSAPCCCHGAATNTLSRETCKESGQLWRTSIAVQCNVRQSATVCALSCQVMCTAFRPVRISFHRTLDCSAAVRLARRVSALMAAQLSCRGSVSVEQFSGIRA